MWADPALPEPARGLAAVQEFMRASWAASPTCASTRPTRRTQSHGDKVAWGWRMRGTMTGPIDPPGFAPTGRAMAVDGVDLWTMRDGRIARYRAFYDMNDARAPARHRAGAGQPRRAGGGRAQRLQARLLRRRAR